MEQAKLSITSHLEFSFSTVYFLKLTQNTLIRLVRRKTMVCGRSYMYLDLNLYFTKKVIIQVKVSKHLVSLGQCQGRLFVDGLISISHFLSRKENRYWATGHAWVSRLRPSKKRTICWLKKNCDKNRVELLDVDWHQSLRWNVWSWQNPFPETTHLLIHMHSLVSIQSHGFCSI